MEKINPSKILRQRLAASVGLDKYVLIQEMVRKVDVSENSDFQKTFNGFYMVRRNKEWRRQYYTLFEKTKHLEKVNFTYLLEEIYNLTGQVEASFASKMLATLKPEMPIWDKYVLQYLQIKAPSSSKMERIQSIVSLYDEIVQWYADFFKKEEAKDCLREFDQAFPDYTCISDVKKIDFFLWSIR